MPALPTVDSSRSENAVRADEGLFAFFGEGAVVVVVVWGYFRSGCGAGWTDWAKIVLCGTEKLDMCESVWVGWVGFFFIFFYASLCLCLMVTGEKADGALRESDDIAGALQLPALVRGLLDSYFGYTGDKAAWQKNWFDYVFCG